MKAALVIALAIGCCPALTQAVVTWTLAGADAYVGSFNASGFADNSVDYQYCNGTNVQQSTIKVVGTGVQTGEKHLFVEQNSSSGRQSWRTWSFSCNGTDVMWTEVECNSAPNAFSAYCTAVGEVKWSVIFDQASYDLYKGGNCAVGKVYQYSSNVMADTYEPVGMKHSAALTDAIAYSSLCIDNDRSALITGAFRSVAPGAVVMAALMGVLAFQ